MSVVCLGDAQMSCKGGGVDCLISTSSSLCVLFSLPLFGLFCSCFPLFSELPISNSLQSRWYPILGAITTVVVSVVTAVLESVVVVGAGSRAGAEIGTGAGAGRVLTLWLCYIHI